MMSQNCMEDVVIKEEYVIHEANLNDCNPPWLTSDPTQKCGEVFLGHRGTFTFVCSQCLQTFLDLCSFGEHIRDTHSLPTFESLVSNVVNGDRDPLKLEPAEKDLRIDEDEENSQIYDSFDLEQETIQSDEESLRPAVQVQPQKGADSKTYCCYTCGKIFLRFQVYRKHYYVEHPDMIEKNETNKTDPCNPKDFVPKLPEEMMCKYCLSTFDEPTNYHKHMEFDHPSPKRFSCPHCPHRSYRHKNDRDYHLEIHDGTKRFHCPHCSKAFAFAKSLQAHINTHKPNIHPPPTVESLVSNVVNDDTGLLKLKPAQKVDFDLHVDEGEENSQGIHGAIDVDDNSHLEHETVQSNQKSLTPVVEQANTNSETYCCYTCGKIFLRFQVYRKHYYVEHSDMIDKDNTNEADPCNPKAFVPKIPEEMVCKYCLSTFDEPKNYHKHMEFDHPSPKRYSCPHCTHRPYLHKNDRDYHLDMHDRMKRFHCPHCPKAFEDDKNLQAHVNTHKSNIHSVPTVESLVSNVVNDDVSRLKLKPAEKVKTDMGQYVDEGEGNSQGVHDSIGVIDDSHLEQVAGQSQEESFTPAVKQANTTSKTYCCYTCGKIFIRFGVYRTHYCAEHPDMIEKDNTNETDRCNPTGFVPKIPEKMVCKYCLSTFDEPTIYHKHMEFDHPSPKCYTCPRCPHRPYRHKNSRDYHLDMHDGTRRFQCPYCPKKCSDPSYLRIHINIHLNIKPFACKFCDQKYTQKSSLQIHERIHTKEKPFQCDECGMSFIAQVMLTKHKRKHKNIRNYPCQHCDKAFFSSSELKRHIRTHTRETPYSCSTCGKKFRSRSNLRSHELLHSDNKQYECKLCGKTFAQFPGLYSHMKSHGEVKSSI